MRCPPVSLLSSFVAATNPNPWSKLCPNSRRQCRMVVGHKEHGSGELEKQRNPFCRKQESQADAMDFPHMVQATELVRNIDEPSHRSSNGGKLQQ